MIQKNTNSPVRKQVSFSKIVSAVARVRTQLTNGASLNSALRPALAQLPPESRGAAQALVYASVRKQALSSALLSFLCSRAPSAAVISLLEAALAALYQGHPSAYTVVSETVNAAKGNTETRQAAGFINAVLRRYLREKDSLIEKAFKHDEVRFNAPLWWIERIRSIYPKEAEHILNLGTQHPPMTLRVNTKKTTLEAYNDLLANAGIESHRVGRDAIILSEPLPVERIPGFSDGLSSVQDAGTQLAAYLLPIKAGERVLDACAAPGGKTAHILERCDCRMTALEIDAVRTQKIRETLGRLSLSADIRTADAADTKTWWDGEPFDAILLDAPCTASGVVRRQPDTPWLRRDQDIAKLANEQRILLKALWPLLKNGGKMLYATCSIFPEEGTEQIRKFLLETPDAKLRPLFPGNGGVLTLLPEENPRYEDSNLIPSVHDGFFYALLEKTPKS